jgi:hypothetical protein
MGGHEWIAVWRGFVEKAQCQRAMSHRRVRAHGGSNERDLGQRFTRGPSFLATRLTARASPAQASRP